MSVTVPNDSTIKKFKREIFEKEVVLKFSVLSKDGKSKEDKIIKTDFFKATRHAVEKHQKDLMLDYLYLDMNGQIFVPKTYFDLYPNNLVISVSATNFPKDVDELEERFQKQAISRKQVQEKQKSNNIPVGLYDFESFFVEDSGKDKSKSKSKEDNKVEN